jgi:hypothetical protein
MCRSLLLDLRHLKQVLCFSAHAIAPSQQPVLEAICSNAIEIDETRDASGCGSAASCAPPAGWSAQMRHYYVDCHGKSKLEALELLLRVLNRGTMATVVFSNVSIALFLAGLVGLRSWYADAVSVLLSMPTFRTNRNACGCATR